MFTNIEPSSVEMFRTEKFTAPPPFSIVVDMFTRGISDAFIVLLYESI